MTINKTILISFVFLLLSLKSNSQEMLWNHSSLTVSKHFDNGFYLQNNTDNTIKVIIKYYDKEICNSIVRAKKETKFKFPIDEVSINFTNNTTVSVFYDTECYETDLAYLNRIANSRYRAAREKREIKLAFRTLFSLGEAITPEDWWLNKASKTGNTFMDGIDTYEDYKKNGIDDAFINFAESTIRSEVNKGISEGITGSERIGSIVSNLQQISDLANSEIEFETRDLEEAAKLSFTFIDNSPIYKYGIDFNNGFRKAVDPDGDGISNKNDDCPGVFGTYEYGGCIKEIFVQKRKERRRIRRVNRKRGYPSAILYADYCIANYSQSSKMEYNSNSFSESGFDLGLKFPVLIHQISSGVKSSFLIGGNYRTNKFNYSKNQDENINFFNQRESYISIGYGLLFGANSRMKFMIEPIFGYQLYNNLKAGDFTLGGNDIEKDFFIFRNMADTKSIYKGLRFRLLFGGNATYYKSKNSINASIPISINFGVTKYNASPIEVNQKYQSNLLLEDGTEFEYPDNQLYLNFGISLNF